MPYPLRVKKAVLLYGLCGGLLIAALRFAEYRFLVVEHSIEIYGGLIALVFAIIGIRLGLSLTKQKEQFKQWYDKPLFNAAVTFLEPFPIGVAVALMSAAVLRKRKAKMC